MCVEPDDGVDVLAINGLELLQRIFSRNLRAPAEPLFHGALSFFPSLFDFAGAFFPVTSSSFSLSDIGGLSSLACNTRRGPSSDQSFYY